MAERIEQLEQQLGKAKVLADEQNQQMEWIQDYYKEEIEQVKAESNINNREVKDSVINDDQNCLMDVNENTDHMANNE